MAIAPCVIEWTEEDVRIREKERTPLPQPPLTDSEVQVILNLMESEHDANNGITWDDVDNWTDQVLSQRESDNGKN